MRILPVPNPQVEDLGITHLHKISDSPNQTEEFADAHIRYGNPALDYPFNGTGYNTNSSEFGLSIPVGGLAMSTWDKKCSL